MASSIAFPGQPHDLSPSTSTPPPHLPFRRISLPSLPNATAAAAAAPTTTSNRHSVASFESAPPVRQRRPTNRRSRERTAVLDASMSEKRRRVINEIYETERAYVSGLDLIYTHFLTPLITSLDTPQPLLVRTELTAIFSNFIDIWNLHRAFFSALSSLLTSAPPSDLPPLSPVLLAHFPYLSLYTPFVTSFSSVLLSLANLTATNPAFAAFLRTQEADPRCRKLPLREWLHSIVQRCPRYLLLIKDLISCTDRSDPEHASLVTVHALLSKITLSLNTSLQTHSQTLSLLSLQRATPNLPFQLISPGRAFIRRGPLLQGQVERDAPDEREFLLFSDCLIWLARAEDPADIMFRRPKMMRKGRSKSETELPAIARGAALESVGGAPEERWVFKGRVELVDLEVVVNHSGRDEDEEERARFDVLSPEVSFAVHAESTQERDEWTDAIRDAKAALLASLSTTRPSSTLTSSEATTHIRRALQALPFAPSAPLPVAEPRRGKVEHFVPAIWVPDAKSDACMRCGARFGWRRRRHHCRLCGRCVCAACSGKTFYIADVGVEGAGGKAARACGACYEAVFPVLEEGEEGAGKREASTLGTLSHLPSWQSMPSFLPPPPSPSSAPAPQGPALFNSPPSAFHAPQRARPRPQSQPVMSAPVDGAVDRTRFSVAAVGVHTAAVTARTSVSGEGRAKRWSLVLGRAGRDGGEGGGEGGGAAGRLSELLALGRGRR